jgi:hypothetical protein
MNKVSYKMLKHYVKFNNVALCYGVSCTNWLR